RLLAYAGGRSSYLAVLRTRHASHTASRTPVAPPGPPSGCRVPACACPARLLGCCAWAVFPPIRSFCPPPLPPHSRLPGGHLLSVPCRILGPCRGMTRLWPCDQP